jgi:pimeloyl-ACP methyl ester carboxylesterase
VTALATETAESDGAEPAGTALSEIRLKDGRALSFCVYGDRLGLPVFALHGTPGSRLNFSLADGIAKQRGLRLIAPDRPGCGGSDFKHFNSFTEWTEDLESLADALGLGRFALIGISGGGPYAIAAAHAMPHRVQFTALVSPIGPVADMGPGLRLTPAHRPIFREMPNRPRAAAAAFWTMRTLLRFAPNIAYRGLVARAAEADRPILLREAVKASLLTGHREGLKRGVDGAMQDLRLFGQSWNIPFRDVIVPAVLWQGLEDRNVPAAASEYLADQLANCRLDVIARAGHYWVFDHLQSVLDAVEASMKAGGPTD